MKKKLVIFLGSIIIGVIIFSILNRSEGHSTDFTIQFPPNWEKLDKSERIYPNPPFILVMTPKDDKWTRVGVGTLYIDKKPKGINTLLEWAELEIQEDNYIKQSFKKQFVTSYSLDNETDVYFRVTKDILDDKNDFVQDKYMFSNFLNNSNDRRMWFIMAQFSNKETPEEIKKEIKEIVASFDVLSYKW